jgi:hypothetical protein
MNLTLLFIQMAEMRLGRLEANIRFEVSMKAKRISINCSIERRPLCTVAYKRGSRGQCFWIGSFDGNGFYLVGTPLSESYSCVSEVQ